MISLNYLISFSLLFGSEGGRGWNTSVKGDVQDEATRGAWSKGSERPSTPQTNSEWARNREFELDPC